MDSTPLFDARSIARNRLRAAARFADHDFLHRIALDDLLDRLADLTRRFPLAVQVGARPLADPARIPGCRRLITADSAPLLAGLDVVFREEAWPFAAGSLDLILANMTMHSTSDLPGALIQMRRSLKPDGLFLAALPGEETLGALRQALAEAELAQSGGYTPRIYPSLDKKAAGALLQRAGFALPVVDSHRVRVSYADIYTLMAELRGMGEASALTARPRHFTPRRLFADAQARYPKQEDGRIEALFELVTLTGWGPADSQQKPLKPGSAEQSLTERLS